jgi:hypothetical protein
MSDSLYGIVSPCSCCLNQLDNDMQPGRAACPRRVLSNQIAQLQAAGQDTSNVDYLTISGTDDDHQYINPVYWDEGNSTLIWVALLRDNQGAFDKDGNQITPQLLDPSFDSTYINCHGLPFLPRETEASQRQNGALQEGVEVEVQFTPPQQMLLSPDAFGNFPTVKADGFVRKLNFLNSQPRTQILQDLCLSGT